MDEARRRDERAAAGGDVSAQARALAARVRAGELRYEAVLLAAHLGREDARLVSGGPDQPRDSIIGVFAACPGRHRSSNSPFKALVSLGKHVVSMWAYDTALRSLDVGPIGDKRRDALLVDALYRWIIEDSVGNFRAAQRSSEMIQAMLDPSGQTIDDVRHRVILYALDTATTSIDDAAARSAIQAALHAGTLAGLASEANGGADETAERSEDARQRHALARIALLEDQPFDDDGTPRPVRNPDDEDEEDQDPADYLRFMSGDCWLLAVALREITGFPVYGLRDDAGDFHHAFVLDRRGGVAIDFRGRLPASEVTSGCRGQTIARLPDRTLARFAVGGVLAARDHGDRTCPRVLARGYSDREWEHALRVAERIAAQ